MRTETLEIKFGTSRGRDTYGYTLVSLYVRGKRVARCSGGGYDMAGTVLGEYLQNTFQADLMRIQKRAQYEWHEDKPGGTIRRQGKDLLYGMTAYYKAGKPTKIVLDGACGVSSMQRIAEALGMKLQSTWATSKKSDIYLLEIPARLDK